MGLQEKLNALREKFEASAPKDALEIMHRATEDLKKSDILKNALKVGDTLPDFSLTNSEGQVVRPYDILSGGPLVLTFYRGKW
jgi:hypothetical protein